MAVGIESAMLLVRRSVSMNTWSAYQRVWQEWEQLNDGCSVGSGDWESRLLYFVGSSFASGVSSSAMSRRLSAVAFWFKFRGLQDVTKCFLVRQAMKGFRKGGRVRDGRRPVSYELLLRIGGLVTELCFSAYEVQLFRAAFALAFFGAFRISELVSPGRSKAGGLEFGDVLVFEQSLECWIPRSKTDQVGKGFAVSLQALPGSPMCPVEVVRRYLEVRPDMLGPFLVHSDRTFLSRFQFIRVFRKCVAAAGLAAGQYSSHSFRIGAATEAARWGLSPAVVKRIGRWESDRYRIYVRPHLL